MALSFLAPVFKHNKTTLGRVRGHNLRLDPTRSQIEGAGWFRSDGAAHTEWNAARVDVAKGLATRKDAVLVIEVCIQIGNQTDWREMPTERAPWGAPKDPLPMVLNKIAWAARRAVELQFGEDNIVNFALHLDESTPHVHAVVTPIYEGKLNAKHWTGGGEAMRRVKKELHAAVVAHGIDCEYTPGRSRGDPHDFTLAAGQQPVEGFVDKLSGLTQLKRRVTVLERVERALNKQLQQGYSQLKRVLARVKELTSELIGAEKQIKHLTGENQRLREQLHAHEVKDEMRITNSKPKLLEQHQQQKPRQEQERGG
jgi:hypothetical protein